MDYRMKRIASCLLAGAIVISGTGVGTYGAQTGGVSAVIATGLSSNGSPAAGFSKMLSQCLIESDKAVAEAAAQAEEQVSENDVPVVASEYADIAIAQVDNYVNVRSEPNTDSEVLGKLYNNSAATVLETTEDGWYKITSGSVTGYVKCEYVVTGDEELAKKVSTRYATVTTTTLYVRMEPSTEAGILTMLGEGDDFVVVDDSMKDSGWVIVTTEEGDGYVSTDYVNLCKESLIHIVDGAEIIHLFDEYRCLNYIVHIGSGCFQQIRKIGKCLFRLSHRPLRNLSCLRYNRDNA